MGASMVRRLIDHLKPEARQAADVRLGLGYTEVRLDDGSTGAAYTFREEFARGCREVVILGASTPLCPPAFASTPVTLLSGVVVDSAEGLLRVVSEGGGMRVFKGLVSKVNRRVKNGR